MSFTQTAYALSDEFTVRTFLGSDTTPPSTPGGLSAVTVSLSQIDLSWSASTDNVAVAGYQVFRDGTFIGTTTALFYNDANLASSTSYTYTITAFDASGNISLPSLPVTETTLSPPVVPPQPQVTEESRSEKKSNIATPVITFLQVYPSTTTALIRYETSGYTRGILSWGKTVSYEIGSLAESLFTTRHETILNNLEPGKVYKFKIGGIDSWGKEVTLIESVFTTEKNDKKSAPGNVWGLSARITGIDVALSWHNPPLPTSRHIRVVRSDIFYPKDTQDGMVVYEGKSESFEDKKVGIRTGTVYYSVFVVDDEGGASSGSVIAVRMVKNGDTESIPVFIQRDEENIPLNPLKLSFGDVSFYQNGEEARKDEGRVYVDGSQDLTISIPYEKLPERLKTIIIVIKNDDDKELSFMLRLSADKERYEGTLSPFGVSGSFPVRVAVYDYETAQRGYAEGVLLSLLTHTESNVSPSFTHGSVRATYLICILLAILGGVLWALVFLMKRKREKEDNT